MACKCPSCGSLLIFPHFGCSKCKGFPPSPGFEKVEDTVHKLIVKSQVSPDRDLWLVTPDTWNCPDGLRVLWLVMGHPDKVGRTITIPIKADDLEKIIKALCMEWKEIVMSGEESRDRNE